MSRDLRDERREWCELVAKAHIGKTLKTAVGGEVFLTQRSRDAENAEKIENLGFYRSDLNNLLFHPLGDVLLQRNLMHSSSYSQNSRHSLRSQPLCGSA